MTDIITPLQYSALSEEEKKNYSPSKWSSYKTIIEEDSCYECGHIHKDKRKVPRKNAKIIEFKKYFGSLRPEIWQPAIQEYLNKTLISKTILK